LVFIDDINDVRFNVAGGGNGGISLGLIYIFNFRDGISLRKALTPPPPPVVDDDDESKLRNLFVLLFVFDNVVNVSESGAVCGLDEEFDVDA